MTLQEPRKQTFCEDSLVNLAAPEFGTLQRVKLASVEELKCDPFHHLFGSLLYGAESAASNPLCSEVTPVSVH